LISWKNTDSLGRDEELDAAKDCSETSLTSTATPVLKSARAADQDNSLNHPFFATDCLEINGSNISNAGRDQYNVTVNYYVDRNLILGA
jgi:hypothetical protein